MPRSNGTGKVNVMQLRNVTASLSIRLVASCYSIDNDSNRFFVSVNVNDFGIQETREGR